MASLDRVDAPGLGRRVPHVPSRRGVVALTASPQLQTYGWERRPWTARLSEASLKKMARTFAVWRIGEVFAERLAEFRGSRSVECLATVVQNMGGSS